MIKTSVIIPVYNTAQYLEECIESVFRQTQQEIEVIAINDGSMDNSWEVLIAMKKKYPQLIIINQENHGLGYTRNVGMDNAKGEYIYFLDSDDYILEDTLEICYKYASKYKLDIVLFDAINFEDSDERKEIHPNPYDRREIIKEKNQIFSGLFFLNMYYKKSYVPASCFVYCSFKFLKENKVKFLPKVYFEDNEFYCRIMTLANRIMYIPRIFYQRRCRNTSITGTNFDLRKAIDHIDVINKITELKNLSDGKGWYVVKRINLILLKHVAKVCHDNSLYNEDIYLSKRILKAWMKICGCDIEFVEDLEDIYYIRKMYEFFPKSDLCIEKQQIDLRQKQLLTKIFRQLPLKDSRNMIAIYGCGNYTNEVLNLYEKVVGTITANIIYLDSYIEHIGKRYRGCPVYNVRDIMGANLDYILISSPQYEEEMRNMINRLYKDKFLTVLLYGDLHICL